MSTPRGEILTELKLVEQLGVSRPPIREALQRLEHALECCPLTVEPDGTTCAQYAEAVMNLL